MSGNGVWELNKNQFFWGAYGQALEAILDKSSFEYLLSSDPGLNGTSEGPTTYEGSYDDVSDIEKMFVDRTSIIANSLFVAGVDMDELRSALTEVIDPLSNMSIRHYHNSNERFTTLLNGYNSQKDELFELGGLNLSWELTIRKKFLSSEHKVTLTVSGRAVQYNSYSHIASDYHKLVEHFDSTPLTFPDNMTPSLGGNAPHS